MTEPDNNENNIQVNVIKITSTDEEINQNTIEQSISDDPDDKKLLRKLDRHLLPTMTLLFFLSYLDRINIGQIKISGLMQSIPMTSAQYNACLSVFFATYLVFEIPSNLVLKKLRPSRWIPLIMITWGTTMGLTGLVNSYGSFLACRIVLGAAEAGLVPGALFHLSTWYKRRELTWRISTMYSAGPLAGAFGGILAFGISKMNGLGGQEGWRWIFYIEGIVTVIVGALAFFLVPDFPSDRPKFVTKEECDRIINRLRTDAGPGAAERFSWQQVAAAFLDWRIYLFCICYIGIIEPPYSFALFSPTIIQSLGFQSYHAQLMSVPPHAFAFITTMITAYFSDKYARFGVFIVFWLLISMIGFIILIVVEDLHVKYFAVFLTAGGISPSLITCIAFISCNISPHTKRATALGFVLAVGNIGGIVSGQTYRSEDAPRFILGHAINLGFYVICLISALILFGSLRFENGRRDRLYGPVVRNKRKTDRIATGTNEVVVDVFALGSEEDRQKWGYGNMPEKEICDLGDRHVAWRYIT